MNELALRRNRIFVTVGTQLPFNRLIKAIDSWAWRNSQNEIFAQVGERGIIPDNFASQARLTMTEFKEKVEQADLLVSHAGMGSIITAIDIAKPIVILPRLAIHGEHRNDHQLATAAKFSSIDGLYLAQNENEVAHCIECALAAPKPTVEDGKWRAQNWKNTELISTVRTFILDEYLHNANASNASL